MNDGSVFQDLGLDTVNNLSVRCRCVLSENEKVAMGRRAKTTIAQFGHINWCSTIVLVKH